MINMLFNQSHNLSVKLVPALTAILSLVMLQSALADTLPDDIAAGWAGGWTKSMENRYKSHGYKIVKGTDGHPVRFGDRSIRFEVRPGDCGNDGNGWNDCRNDRERHELRANTTYRNGQEMWYAYSLFIPENTPAISPTNVHLGQFLQPRQKVFWLFSWDNRGLVIEAVPPKSSGKVMNTGSLVSNHKLRRRWHDILIHARWSRSKNGFFNVYSNHNLRFKYSGQTLAAGRSGDFKFGIYRSRISKYVKVKGKAPPTQIAYYDEVHRGTNLKAADRVGIADIQQFLSKKGLYSGPVDGLWGTNTKDATNAWLTTKRAEPIEDYSISLWKEFSDELASQ